jgi:hypothetical protein
MQKLFCIIREFRVLGGNYAAQYVENDNLTEIMPPNHTFGAS